MRILVADDVPSARKILRKLLVRLGYADVVEVSNGQEGLDLLKGETFDLIISDWEMPKVDGIEMLHALRALPDGGDIPVLFVTSSNEKEQVLAALKAGVAGYLCKPFSLQILGDKIKELCQSSRDT